MSDIGEIEKVSLEGKIRAYVKKERCRGSYVLDVLPE